MRKYLLFIIISVLALKASAQPLEQSGSQRMQERLDSLLTDTLLQTTQLGLMVWDLTADSLLYAHDERQLMRPASTMKVLTAVTALDRFGEGYQLKTTLCYQGRISGKTLQGNLVCIGGMDPCFDRYDMKTFAERVAQLGIDTIGGTLLADLSMKDTLRYGEGWCWDDDNPVLTPLLYEGKDAFIAHLRTELRRAGVVVADSVIGTKGFERVPIVTRTHSIDQLLQRMMKDSDNLYAECLYYHLAASGNQRPASAIHARRFERQLINRLGLNGNRYRFADGSGLSLYNYLSAEVLTLLLRYAWQQPVIIRQLWPSLPIAADDGTLKKRLAGTTAAGNVRAKTGTVSGISSLAGYVMAPNGHMLCFAIINQGVMRAQWGRDFQDKICIILSER